MQIDADEDKNEELEKGRQLQEFMSINREVLDARPGNEGASGVRDVEHGELLTQAMVGANWSVNKDTSSSRVTLDEKPLTQCRTLTTAASVFGPLEVKGIG